MGLGRKLAELSGGQTKVPSSMVMAAQPRVVVCQMHQIIKECYFIT